ncbi:MAG: S1/P1 nuclease [Vicinamibacteria bacterium]
MHRVTRFGLSILFLAALVVHPSSLLAWDLFGHHVVGAVAWDELSPSTRLAVCELLQKAPTDSDLPGLLPPGPRPLEVRCRELFIKAQGWADLVRDEIWSNRKERYDHPEWHYVNHFWTTGPPGPRALPERGTLGELSTRLPESIAKVGNPAFPAPERAVALAWVLHLTGDAHQPLHSSGRVTSLEPKGDRGGNDFALDDLESPNLHALWDSILRRARRQSHAESYFRWVSRVAVEVETLPAKESLSREIAIDSPEAWSREGAAIAMSSAYPEYLERNAPLPKRHEDEVFAIARRQAALAGYRLARVLERALAGASESAPNLLAHQIP